MLHQAGIRRLLLSAALFRSVVFFASTLPVASQETKPSASAQSASTQNEPAPFKEAGDYFRKGSFDQALPKYNEALKSGTPPPAAYTRIVPCYFRQDQVHDPAHTLYTG